MKMYQSSPASIKQDKSAITGQIGSCAGHKATAITDNRPEAKMIADIISNISCPIQCYLGGDIRDQEVKIYDNGKIKCVKITKCIPGNDNGVEYKNGNRVYSIARRYVFSRDMTDNDITSELTAGTGIFLDYLNFDGILLGFIERMRKVIKYADFDADDISAEMLKQAIYDSELLENIDKNNNLEIEILALWDNVENIELIYNLLNMPMSGMNHTDGTGIKISVDQDFQQRPPVFENTPGEKKTWKTSKTKEFRNRLLSELPKIPLLDLGKAQRLGMLKKKDTELKITLHHKMSRRHIGRLIELYNEKQDKDSQMEAFFHRLCNMAHSSDRKLSMINWAANIEIGPDEQKRSDDPGADFDGNVQDGLLTPRSRLLSSVDDVVVIAKTWRDVNWTDIGISLIRTMDEHEKRLSEQGKQEAGMFTNPILEQWLPSDSVDKFSRAKPNPPIQ